MISKIATTFHVAFMTVFYAVLTILSIASWFSGEFIGAAVLSVFTALHFVLYRRNRRLEQRQAQGYAAALATASAGTYQHGGTVLAADPIFDHSAVGAAFNGTMPELDSSAIPTHADVGGPISGEQPLSIDMIVVGTDTLRDT